MTGTEFVADKTDHSKKTSTIFYDFHYFHYVEDLPLRYDLSAVSVLLLLC